MYEFNTKLIVNYLNELLKPESYKDMVYNGVQVDAHGFTFPDFDDANSNNEKIVVCGAVDACCYTIEEAINRKASLLIVHHGLGFGKIPPVNRLYGKRVASLIKNECSLYASHLPLDGNMTVGNGYLLAKLIELESITPYYDYLGDGNTVGVRGAFKNPIDFDKFVSTIKKKGIFEPILPLPFGKKKISTVAVVTGSASNIIPDCSKDNIDLLITGEPKQEAYHSAKDLKQNALFLGHYTTETFGVSGLLNKIKEKDFGFPVECSFIDCPTGI